MKLYTDGGSRGNPGESAIGYFLFDEDDKLIDFGGNSIGVNTNNFAEYQALIAGIKLALKYNPEELNCTLDSELVVKQLKGGYKVKDETIKKLYFTVLNLLREVPKYTFTHVRREYNKFTDKLVNIILDSKEKDSSI